MIEEDGIQRAASVLSNRLRAEPLTREAWLQFIFEGDATQYPPNFSASSDGNLGIGASSHGGRLALDGVPHIEFHCDAGTFQAIVNGDLPLEQARASGALTVTGGKDIVGNNPTGGQADEVREALVKELVTRLAPLTSALSTEGEASVILARMCRKAPIGEWPRPLSSESSTPKTWHEWTSRSWCQKASV